MFKSKSLIIGLVLLFSLTVTVVAQDDEVVPVNPMSWFADYEWSVYVPIDEADGTRIDGETSLLYGSGNSLETITILDGTDEVEVQGVWVHARLWNEQNLPNGNADDNRGYGQVLIPYGTKIYIDPTIAVPVYTEDVLWSNHKSYRRVYIDFVNEYDYTESEMNFFVYLDGTQVVSHIGIASVNPLVFGEDEPAVDAGLVPTGYTNEELVVDLATEIDVDCLVAGVEPYVQNTAVETQQLYYLDGIACNRPGAFVAQIDLYSDGAYDVISSDFSYILPVYTGEVYELVEFHLVEFEHQEIPEIPYAIMTKQGVYPGLIATEQQIAAIRHDVYGQIGERREDDSCDIGDFQFSSVGDGTYVVWSFGEFVGRLSFSFSNGFTLSTESISGIESLLFWDHDDLSWEYPLTSLDSQLYFDGTSVVNNVGFNLRLETICIS